MEPDIAASGFGHFGLDERRSLFRLRAARVPVTEVASPPGQRRLTIYRELARDGFRHPDAARDRRREMFGYPPVTAQDQALAPRRWLVKLARHANLLAHVIDRLRTGWSPQQIAGRLRLYKQARADGEAIVRLCHETITAMCMALTDARSSSTYACPGRGVGG